MASPSKKHAPVPGFVMTDEIQQVFDRFGLENIFLTGRAGTGKSTVVQQLLAATDQQVAIVAPTGVAALNVGGQTIHSFFRFGWDVVPDTASHRSPRDPDLFRSLGTLIVDEASMVPAHLLDCVDHFLRRYGGSPWEPFGGVRLLLVGDAFQLPPVVKGLDPEVRSQYATNFFFGAESYRLAAFNTAELTQPFRQSDREFLAVLDAVRDGNVEHRQLGILNGRVEPEVSPDYLRDSESTMLCTHRAQAAGMNRTILDSLPERAHVFTAQVDGDFPKSSFPTSTELQLKVGARVMLLVNTESYVNGSVGVVTNVVDRETVKVELSTGKNVRVSPHSWEQVGYQSVKGQIVRRVVGSFRQLPVQLAWACTIHKAQGLSLDRAIINLGQNVFACGQLYVALSRLRTLEGLTITPRPIQLADIKVDPAVKRFMAGVTA